MAQMTQMALAANDSDSSGGLLRPWQFFLLAGMLGATAAVVVGTGQAPASIIVLSLTVVSAAFVGLGLYRTVLPLVSPASAEAPLLIGGRTRAALEREKMLVLRSIKELEFDFAMGKVARADFDEMDGRLRARAFGLMQQLDAGGGYREQIERELERRLAETGVRAPEPLPSSIESPEIHDVDAPSRTCASCGVANDPDARFCKGCGTRLAGAA
jgi:hypothetical protein